MAKEDLVAARDLVDEIKNAELFLYPGDGHLFATRRSPASLPTAATRTTWSAGRRRWERVPDDLPAEDTAPLMCAGVTTFNARSTTSIARRGSRRRALAARRHSGDPGDGHECKRDVRCVRRPWN